MFPACTFSARSMILSAAGLTLIIASPADSSLAWPADETNAQGHDQDTEALQHKFEAFDNAYSAGFRCEGTQVISGLPLDPDGRDVARWRYSWSNGRQAVEQSFEPPQFGANIGGSVFAHTKVLTLYDTDMAAQFTAYKEFMIDPRSREAVDAGSVNNRIKIQPPDSPTHAFNYFPILWGAGRGFGKYVDIFTEVRPRTSSGLIPVTASGDWLQQSAGEWQLSLDPEASYLVRKAAFYRAGQDEPRVIVENEGLQRNGDCFLPVKGKVALLYQGEEDITYEMTYESGSLEKDEQLFQEVRDHVTEPYPNKSHVIDNRSEPGKTYTVRSDGTVWGRQRPVATAMGQSARRSWMMYLIIANVVVVCLLVVIALVQRRSRPTS